MYVRPLIPCISSPLGKRLFLFLLGLQYIGIHIQVGAPNFLGPGSAAHPATLQGRPCRPGGREEKEEIYFSKYISFFIGMAEKCFIEIYM